VEFCCKCDPAQAENPALQVSLFFQERNAPLIELIEKNCRVAPGRENYVAKKSISSFFIEIVGRRNIPPGSFAAAEICDILYYNGWEQSSRK